MSGAAATGGTTQRAVRPVVTYFFYTMEFVFATVSGYSESGIYGAYSEHDWTNLWGSLARAALTQIAIVFFGIAAVNAAKNKQWAGVWASNVLTFMFALVAVWFIHESALVNASVTQLLPAYNQPVNFFGITLDGRYVDPWLIASLPLFQVALNWLAPYIVAATNEVVETAEEQDARFAREEREKQHKAQMAVLNAKTRRAQIQALRGKDDEDEANKASESTDDTTTIAEDKDAVLPEERPRIEPHLVALSWHDKDAQWWDKAALIAWALDEYSTTITEAKANTFLQESSKDEQGRPARIASQGNPYTANKDDVMAYAKKMLRLKKAPRNTKTKTADNVVPFDGNRAANG